MDFIAAQDVDDKDVNDVVDTNLLLKSDSKSVPGARSRKKWLCAALVTVAVVLACLLAVTVVSVQDMKRRAGSAASTSGLEEIVLDTSNPQAKFVKQEKLVCYKRIYYTDF